MKKKVALITILCLAILLSAIAVNSRVPRWETDYKDAWFRIGDYSGPGLLSGSFSSGAHYGGAWQVTLGLGDYNIHLGRTGEDVYSASGEKVREANRLNLSSSRWSDFNQ